MTTSGDKSPPSNVGESRSVNANSAIRDSTDLEIKEEEGESKIYGPGDAIFMPKGFNGTWRQLSPIKKIYVSHSAG